MVISERPAALHMRPMTPADAERWAALRIAVEQADDRGEHYDVADCREELTHPDLDLATDSVLVLDGEVPVAYQVLHVGTAALVGLQCSSDAAVHPAHRGRGVGTALVALARNRADALGATFDARIDPGNAAAVDLLENAGLVVVREWADLSRDLAEPVAAAPPVSGCTVTALGPPYEARRWDEPLRAAHNAAFADHWGVVPDSAAGWAHLRTAERTFRPDCSAVAVSADGAIAGYVLAYDYPAAFARTGDRDLYLDLVGTAAAWRGRGVATALLEQVLTVGAAAGFTSCSLSVDTRNEAALRAYTRAGFVTERGEATFATTG